MFLNQFIAIVSLFVQMLPKGAYTKLRKIISAIHLNYKFPLFDDQYHTVLIINIEFYFLLNAIYRAKKKILLNRSQD